jgi:hypothetical protein
MRRLIKKAFGIDLYHVTDFKGFCGILQSGMIYADSPANAGIKDNSSYGQDRMDQGSDRSRYKENLYEEAIGYSEEDVDNYLGRVFLLSKDKLSKELSTYGSIAVRLRLPEDALLPDNNDCRDCKTAKESLDKIGQCSIIGDIASNYFDYYLFFNTSNEIILEKDAQKTSNINDFFTNKDIFLLIKGNRYTIEDFKNAGFDFTDDLFMELIKEDGYKVLYVENPTDEMKLQAVKSNGATIEFIKNPSEELQLEAVKQYGLAIRYIENPSLEVQLEAVRKSAYAINFISNPVEEVQLEAIKNDKRAIQLIENPSEKVIKWLKNDT